MAKRKKKKRRFNHGLERDTIYGVTALLLIVLAVFFIFAAFDSAGVLGTYLYKGLSTLFGIGYILLPTLSVLISIAFFKARHHDLLGRQQLLGGTLFLVSGLGIIDLFFTGRGGLVGGWIMYPLNKLFGNYVSGSLLVSLVLISLLIMFSLSVEHIRILLQWRRNREDGEEDIDPNVYDPTDDEEVDNEEIEEDTDNEEEDAEPKKKRGLFGGKKDNDDELNINASLLPAGPYTPPPLSLLSRETGKARPGDIKANANIIKRTLANFGIDIEIEEITIGPSIARYAIKPAEGVRLSRILSLQNNLELALAAHPVRIEAPIPGRSLVGIEVPNSAKSTVSLASLISSKEYAEVPHPLAIPLGRDVSGSVKVAPITKMPHLLIAGATGAGKSVMIHTIVTSLMYNNSPDQLKFILVDPKRVELTLYKGTPHLLTPVITDPKRAVLALKWLTNEMERRYQILEEYSVRDISSYHASVLKPALENGGDDEEMPETLPYIVLIIDELADIMSTYPRELEASIVRIAQMSRAVGIHLILSTQRPSVNVITGLIKANIPARIALQVTSQIDSRTILDMAGAEKLLGAGDMLYLSGEMAKPIRLQSGFISESEVKKVSKHLRKHNEVEDEEISFSEDSISSALDNVNSHDDDEDDLYEDARETVIQAGKASTSYLQRKLRIGYSRAARLIDMLEERGVVGSADGSRPREILDDASAGDEFTEDGEEE